MTGNQPLKNKLNEVLKKNSADYGYTGAMVRMAKRAVEELASVPDRQMARSEYKLQYLRLNNNQLCQAVADACVITLNYVINSNSSNSPRNADDRAIGNFATFAGALLDVVSGRLKNATDIAPKANMDFKGGASRLSSLERLLFSYACAFDKEGYKVPNLDWITQARDGKAGIFPLDLTQVNERVNDYYLGGINEIMRETVEERKESPEKIDATSLAKGIAKELTDNVKVLGELMFVPVKLMRTIIKGLPDEVLQQAVEETNQLQLAGASGFLEPDKIQLILPYPQMYKYTPSVQKVQKTQKANANLPPQKDGGR